MSKSYTELKNEFEFWRNGMKTALAAFLAEHKARGYRLPYLKTLGIDGESLGITPAMRDKASSPLLRREMSDSYASYHASLKGSDYLTKKPSTYKLKSRPK